MNYPFPGNIRELENILEHASVLCHGALIEEKHLPHDFLAKTNRDDRILAEPPPTLASSEKEFIWKILKEQGGSRVNTARKLGISRTTLWRKIKKHDLQRDH